MARILKRSPKQYFFWTTVIVAVFIVVGYIFGSSLAYNRLSLVSRKTPQVTPSGQVENMTFPARG